MGDFAIPEAKFIMKCDVSFVTFINYRHPQYHPNIVVYLKGLHARVMLTDIVDLSFKVSGGMRLYISRDV